MLSAIIMLNVVMLSGHSEKHCDESCYAGFRYSESCADYNHAECVCGVCPYFQCHYAACSKMNDILLSVILLTIAMMNASVAECR